MSPLADAILAHVPLPQIPRYLTSYVPGETPLSTTTSVVATLVSYLVTIFGVQAAMRNHTPHKLSPLFRAHNMFLSIGSLVLLVLMLEEILPILWKEGIYAAMCAETSWTSVRVLTLLVSMHRSRHFQRMEFYYMINYSFKYLELLDTVFLAFKKKPLREFHGQSAVRTDWFGKQSSSTFSIMLPPPCYAFPNSMARPAS